MLRETGCDAPLERNAPVADSRGGPLGRVAARVRCAAQVVLQGAFTDGSKKHGLLGKGLVQLVQVKNQWVLRFKGLEVLNVWNDPLAIFWSSAPVGRRGAPPARATTRMLRLDLGTGGLYRGSMSGMGGTGARRGSPAPAAIRRLLLRPPRSGGRGIGPKAR